jgi:hypothetical protein
LSPILYKPAPFRPYVTAKPAGDSAGQGGQV